MKKQRYIVEIEMPDGDFISAGLIKDIIQTDCDVEDEGRMKVIVQETSLPSNLDEAAEEIAKSEIPVVAGEALDLNGDCYETDDINWPERCGFIRGFKAGAELTAGQFVLVGGEPTGWFRANNGSEYATGLDLEEPIKLPVDFYVRKK